MGKWRNGYKRPNPERDKKVRNLRETKKRKEMREWFQKFKSKLSCKRCGASHPAFIIFHHKDPKAKVAEVSVMVCTPQRYPKNKILKEIEKCEILCSNCHRILHWEERNK